MPEPQNRTPRWHTIDALPLFTHMIDGQLASAEEQHRLLLQARPGSLDGATVERVVRVFTEAAENLGVNQEQLNRWCKEPLTAAQRSEVERLGMQVARNHDVDAAILALADDLKAITIDAILAKSDLELGLELLTGHSQLFQRGRPQRP